MKRQIINFLRAAFPFLLTIGLWRISVPFWNPGGVLALVPVFYCSFVRPTPWFAPVAVLACFLVDYSFDTRLFWTAAYCLFYAINGFQTAVDLTRMDRRGITAFMTFFGIAVLILGAMHINFTNILRGVWLFAWVTALYIPITWALEKGTYND